jgi:hypothetical protein
MAKGSLLVQITDLRGNPIRATVEVDFKTLPGETGAGGEPMELSVNMGSATDLTITSITCRGGPGTNYKVSIATPHYRPYRFFQLIREDRVNPAADNVEFWVKPGDVKDIRAPQFGDLPSELRTMLSGANMVVDKPEDADLVGASGASLYRQLGPVRKACLLNIAKKASHPTAAHCLSRIGGLMVSRQDRIFALVDARLPAELAASPRFTSADSSLHDPLPGFRLTGQSFKSRDAHANLQVTFLKHEVTAALAADVDIDESSGIEHGLEVIKNALFRKKTNPYLIREFLLSADFLEHTLDPGYDFVF